MSIKAPGGYISIAVDEVGSTMDEALGVAESVPTPMWIMARRQTKPRARRGKTWISADGSMSASLSLPSPGSYQEAAQRSFVAALAVWQVVDLVAENRCTVKWPNDVLLDGRKVAGILLETTGGGTRPTSVCIGIGINITSAPERHDLEPRAVAPISLREAFVPHPAIETADQAFEVLTENYAHWEEIFLTRGFEEIRKNWLQHAHGLGHDLTARVGKHTYRGRFKTIDETGALVLDTADGQKVIAAAEIYF